jgi:hypothetical protein
MSETWYRGEAVGGSTSKPGGNLHDLGDGLYFTDTEDVAWQYAKIRAPGYKEYRVSQVSVDRISLGRVLDLTADGRWNKFMLEPLLPGRPGTRLSFVRQQNELYGQFFEEFLRLNGIDISSYDAVIGPEYVRGGKQLCVLNKNNLPSRLAARLRSLMVPEAWAARLSRVAGRWGRLSFPRAAGGLVINVAINVVIAYLIMKLREKVDEAFIRKQMREDIGPEIDRFVAAYRRMVLDNLSSGQQAYVTGAIQVRSVQLPKYDDLSLPVVQLSMLMISAKDWSSTPPKRDVETSYSGMITYINEVTFSTEISVPKEDVDDYRDILQQEKWYQDRLKDNTLTDADRLQLKKQYESLLDWEDKTYGRFDEYVPRPGNWTDDGYADVSGHSK